MEVTKKEDWKAGRFSKSKNKGPHISSSWFYFNLYVCESV